MLIHVGFKNFLSLIEANLDLSPTGLTVLIGPNGSGKSNLVKALEFISEIGNAGLHRAIYNAGGRETILPKSIERRAVRRYRTTINYTIQLPKPKSYPLNAPNPSVYHQVEIKWTKPTDFNVSQERLKFNEPITLSRAIQKEQAKSAKRPNMHKEDRVETVQYVPSSITFERSIRNTCKIKTEPEFDISNLKDYVHWFGLDFLHGESSITNTIPGFKRFITYLSSKYPCASTGSLIDEPSPVMRFSSHFSQFKRTLGQIKRYDLQLSELRREQPITRYEELGKEGEFLPSSFGKLAVEPETSSRIKETLSAIAPHIMDISINRLRTGKEYLEFMESKLGRPVESWVSSDGTLRALAIMVALETHMQNQTILIEEPEQCLHPWAIRILINHIRQVISQRKLQVVLTTHSQQVLECVTPDEVVVVSRKEQEGTKFYKIPVDPQIKIDMGEVGRLWVKGLLGGVPEYGE